MANRKTRKKQTRFDEQLIAGDKGLVPIRVLVADDQEAMLDRVARLLAIEFNVVGTVTDGQQVLEATLKLSPDVLVLDISMPVVNGIEAARRVISAGSKTRIVFLTMHDDPDFVWKALEVGALGYVIKSRLIADLVTAVREAHSGRSFLSPTLRRDRS